MSDYRYIIGSLFGMALFLLILGNMGAADDIYGDDYVVIDSNNYPDGDVPEHDFDVDRIRFTPNVPEQRFVQSSSFGTDEIFQRDEVDISSNNVVGWTGLENDGGFYFQNHSSIEANDTGFGYLTLDVEDRFDTVSIPFTTNFLGGDPVGFWVEDVNGTVREVTGGSPREIDLSGDSTSDDTGEQLANIKYLGIAINGEDASADLGGGNVNAETGAFVAIGNFLNFLLSSTYEAGTIVAGYIAFTASVPGLLGTVMRIYIGIFLPVFLIKEFWIG